MRVETISNATLYLADSLEVLPTLDAANVDMIWTDPPYGHSNHVGDFNARLNEHRGIAAAPIANDGPDEMRRVVDGVLTEAVRLLKPDCCCCCCCCGGGPKPTFAWLANRMDQGGLQFFHSVIWDKKNPGIGWRYRRQHEMVMVAHTRGGKLLWADDTVAVPNIFSEMPSRLRSHPNEKPVSLVEFFLNAHSLPGQMVLDPFMGSGTTGVAAITSGRRFIGIEIDERHFTTACERIEQATKQGSLFDPGTPTQAGIFA